MRGEGGQKWQKYVHVLGDKEILKWRNVELTKIGPIFDKVVQTLKLSKNNFNKNCTSKLLFLIEKNQNVI